MRHGIVLAALALVVGCEKGRDVEPAASARVSDGQAIDSSAGVTVQVDPTQYLGVEGDAGELVQLHLEIDNNAGRPLELSYADFTLRASGGRSWTALDPDRVDLSTVGLRDDLLKTGISEHIFETGNEMDGYIYFQGVDRDVRRANLHIRLRDANTNERFGELEVPLMVYPEDATVSMY